MPAEEPVEPPTPADPEEVLAWEERARPRAAVAAVVAAVLPLAGVILSTIVYNDAPDGDEEANLLRYVDDHGAGLLVSAVLLLIGYVGLSVLLHFLFRATKARRPELANAARPLAVAAPVLVGVASVAFQAVLLVQANDFAGRAEQQTDAVAKDLLTAPGLQVVGTLRFGAALALAFGLVLIALNAMRAGLLTRFMGILGIIVGVLFVLPLGSPLPIVQTFWLGALALLVAGRWPNEVPPAWRTGRAEPWPSAQEIREERERMREEGAPEPEPEEVAATAEGPQHPASRKRKRKRRR